jgi:hypothetical protein
VSRKRKEGHRKRRRRLRASIRRTVYVVPHVSGLLVLSRHVSPSLPGPLAGRLLESVEVAWQDEPGITIQTDSETGLPAARVWGSPLPPESYRSMLRRDPCSYCGRMPVPHDHPGGRWRRGTIEHLHRLVDGGGGMLENIVGACSHCNSTRGDRSVLENLAIQRNTVIFPPRRQWPETWRIKKAA